MIKIFRRVFFVLALLLFFLPLNCYEVNAQTVKDELKEEVSSQIKDFNFSELDKILENFGVDSKSIFGSESFSEKLNNLINGKYTLDSQSIFQTIINILFENILEIFPIFCSIVTIVILCSFISQIRSSVNGKSINDIVHFVCYAIIIIIVSKIVIDSLNTAKDTILSMQKQMDIIFPMLLTLMSAVGSAVSASVYQPAIAFLTA